MDQRCPLLPAVDTHGSHSRYAGFSLPPFKKHTPSGLTPQSLVDPKFFLPSGLISILCLSVLCSLFIQPQMLVFSSILGFKATPLFRDCLLFHCCTKPFVIVMLNYSLPLSSIVFDPLGSGLLMCCPLESLSLFLDVPLMLQNESGVVWWPRSSRWEDVFEQLCKKRFFFNVIFIFCFSCCQSTREAEIKLKSESRVKLFYLDPDAQVRTIF